MSITFDKEYVRGREMARGRGLECCATILMTCSNLQHIDCYIVSRGWNAAFRGHWYFHLFYDGPFVVQIWVLLTISDAQMTGKVCGPLAFYLNKIVIWMQCNIRYCKNKPSILTCLIQNCNLHVLNIVEPQQSRSGLEHSPCIQKVVS